MKSFIFSLVLLFLGLNALAQDAKSVFISCSGQHSEEKELTVELAAYWVPGEELERILIVLQKEEPSTISKAILKPYNPINIKYQGFNRFEIGSNSWGTTSILLPEHRPYANPFRAYYYNQGRSGIGTIDLLCSKE